MKTLIKWLQAEIKKAERSPWSMDYARVSALAEVLEKIEEGAGVWHDENIRP